MTDTVPAAPTKSFFVSMLTRDIKLEDAILDLLDNCVDGILRSCEKDGSKPYEGFKAEIKFDSKSFSISDNCGGIPWGQRNYAFRMGRPPQNHSKVSKSVGVYGIGMKRAIFKIGKQCTISTRNADKCYEVRITPEWMRTEDGGDVWNIPVIVPAEPRDDEGTTITINDLNKDIPGMFVKSTNRTSFRSILRGTISTHYAHIMEKGFEVTINGVAVEPITVKIACDRELKQRDAAIAPYVFEKKSDGVEVYLAVGLTGKISPRSGVAMESGATASRPSDPGWTIICNDRVVLHSDRTELTGWGVDIPKYHTQFIGIAGIVEFKAEDPSDLPTTTTKMGVDVSSSLYRLVKKKMDVGMRMFMDYTNNWKGQANESAKNIQRCELLSLDELKKKRLKFKDEPTLPSSRQYMPDLPVPPEPKTSVITFKRDRQKIETVSKYLFDESSETPNRVGAKCFDIIYGEIVL